MEPIKIKICHEKLVRALEEKKMSAKQLGNELGFADGYINTQHKRGDMYPIAIVKLMGVFLEKDFDYFKYEEKPVKETEAGMKVFDNIFRECKKIQECMEQLTETQESIMRKVNANSVQLEKIKESMAAMAQTDLDIAMEFLKNVLSGGRMEGTSVLLEADSQGIKRSDLMKAKKELNIQVETQGYAKNQKSYWYLKY